MIWKGEVKVYEWVTDGARAESEVLRGLLWWLLWPRRFIKEYSILCSQEESTWEPSRCFGLPKWALVSSLEKPTEANALGGPTTSAPWSLTFSLYLVVTLYGLYMFLQSVCVALDIDFLVKTPQVFMVKDQKLVSMCKENFILCPMLCYLLSPVYILNTITSCILPAVIGRPVIVISPPSARSPLDTTLCSASDRTLKHEFCKRKCDKTLTGQITPTRVPGQCLCKPAITFAQECKRSS